MTEPNSQTDKPEENRRFNQEQHEMLKRCADKEDMTEWNNWRKEHRDEDILLEGGNLVWPHLKGAQLWQAHLEGAKLMKTDLEDANLNGAYLEGADLQRAILRGAEFRQAHLEGTKLLGANLRGADLTEAKLQGADFSRAIVDGDTLIWTYEIDQKTKVEGVGLDAARIYPRTKQLLEYNIRRLNWEEWYEWKDWFKYAPTEPRHKLSQFFLRTTIGCFWSFSNYGLSTKRIILAFFGLALFFAAVYSTFAHLSPPGLVSSLEIEPHLPLWHYFLLLILRPVYFSVVTMTTLGFGDMFANAQSIWGHILLTVQVILGYVLLGASITRFAVLFTAGGPAGKFADEEKDDDGKCRRYGSGYSRVAAGPRGDCRSDR